MLLMVYGLFAKPLKITRPRKDTTIIEPSVTPGGEAFRGNIPHILAGT